MGQEAGRVNAFLLADPPNGLLLGIVNNEESGHPKSIETPGGPASLRLEAKIACTKVQVFHS